jgi:hypothetical protein
MLILVRVHWKVDRATMYAILTLQVLHPSLLHQSSRPRHPALQIEFSLFCHGDVCVVVI